MNTVELTSNLTAAPHEVGLSAKRLACISTTSQGFIDEERLAGAVTVVARRGKVAYFKASGMMDIAANKPMQKDTIFRIYSMTKPIAAVGVMMLCEEGKLQLDAPTSTYLPELDGLKVAVDADGGSLRLVEADRDMTVRDLMRHTAGLPGAARYMAGQTAVDKRYREAGLHRLQTDWIPASQVDEYGWIGGTSTEFWISPRDELVTITLAQHIPFSELSQTLKPLIYAAIL